MDNQEKRKRIRRNVIGLAVTTAAMITATVLFTHKYDSKEALEEYLRAHHTDTMKFIYDGKNLKDLQFYRFKAWKGFTPSHVVFGENVGSVPAWAVEAANKEGYNVVPDMSLYEILNGKGHMPVHDVRVGQNGNTIDMSSDIYAVDLNKDNKIAGRPVSQLEKTTWEACMEQRARRDAEFREFVRQKSYQRGHNSNGSNRG